MILREERIKIFEKYAKEMRNGYPIYIGDEIPTKIFSNAVKKYKHNVINRQEVIALCDSSVFGNGKSSFVFTNEKLYFTQAIGKPEYIEYCNIESCSVLDSNDISITLKNGKNIRSYNSGVKHTALKNFLDEIKEFNNEFLIPSKVLFATIALMRCIVRDRTHDENEVRRICDTYLSDIENSSDVLKKILQMTKTQIEADYEKDCSAFDNEERWYIIKDYLDNIPIEYLFDIQSVLIEQFDLSHEELFELPEDELENESDDESEDDDWYDDDETEPEITDILPQFNDYRTSVWWAVEHMYTHLLSAVKSLKKECEEKGISANELSLNGYEDFIFVDMFNKDEFFSCIQTIKELNKKMNLGLKTLGIKRSEYVLAKEVDKYIAKLRIDFN